MVDKQRDDIANELTYGYFPYTHGDHIELEREIQNADLREELQAKLFS